MAESKKPLITVVVPTKNSGATIDKCLASIKKQSYPSIELVVVDNFSDDDTQEISKKHTKQVFAKGPERCAQRNYGAQKGKGEYVLFIDSDMELTRDVVKEALAAHQRTKRAVVIPEESFGEGFWARCKALEREFYVGVDWVEAARFFSRKEFEAIGGYDENLLGNEDWDLAQRALKGKSASRTEAIIRHNEGRLRLRRTLQKKYYYASEVITYMKKGHKETRSQVSVIRRYALFLSKPGKLFRQPIVGIGMLSMKAAEYVAGALGIAGYYLRRVVRSSN